MVLGGIGEYPPAEARNIVIENGVISEGSIFSNIFSTNNNKIQFFNWIFIKNFQNFLKISQQFAFFVQTAENEHIGLLNSLENICINNAFSQISEETFWKFSKIFSKFPKNLFVVQTRHNLTHGLLNLLKNKLK